MFGMFIPTLIIGLILLALIGSTFNVATISELILDTILMSSVLALGVYSYIKQRG